MALELTDINGSWVYVFPVSGLRIGSQLNGEHRVDRTTFVTVRRLSRVRKRLGVPLTVAQMKRRFPWADFLEDSEQVVAIVHQKGRAKDIEFGVRRIANESLEILSVSQLGYSRRRSNAYPSIDGEHARRTLHFCVDSQTLGGIQSAQLQGKIGDLSLNGRWLDYQKRVFYWKLLQIIHGEVAVSRAWRAGLRRVATLVGQSQRSTDLAQAFLLNMIAIETLLTQQGDKYTDVLPERAEAFIGWIGFWHDSDYESRIRDAYRKRCQYVHDGDASSVTVADVLFLDDIVRNLLANIVGHSDLFQSKAAVIDFSNRVAAERLLGIRNSKVRPKTLRYFSRSYSDDDLRRI